MHSYDQVMPWSIWRLQRLARARAPPPPHSNPWAFDLAFFLVVGNMNLNCQAFLVENNCFIFE